jgi:hypothetical protein
MTPRELPEPHERQVSDAVSDSITVEAGPDAVRT